MLGSGAALTALLLLGVVPLPSPSLSQSTSCRGLSPAAEGAPLFPATPLLTAALAGAGDGASLSANDANDSAAAAEAAAPFAEPVVAAPAQPELPPAAGPQSPARKFFTDVEVVDQDGHPHRLYSDLLQGKTVVVEAFFTSCTDSCPQLAERMTALQQWVGDRLGKDVYLLSFSVDPRQDTPARLKRYAEQLGARPGWFFLTGKPENIGWALYKFGQYAADKSAHSNLLVLGNERAGLWKKVFGLAPAGDLIHSFDSVLHDRG
jgi:protein SCO1/2